MPLARALPCVLPLNRGRYVRIVFGGLQEDGREQVMSDSEEFRLKIEAYSPETMPMSRLAEYLGGLAEMLGESTFVHFVTLEQGSTSVVHRIQKEAIPKVRHRTRRVSAGVGARDAVRAYQKINRMVREDNGRATWQRNREDDLSSEAIVFPGKDEAQQVFVSETRFGSVEGEILRIGGVNNFVPILLRFENEEFSGCYADKSLAKELGKWLFEPVRLFGSGRWNRDEEGKWKLEKFRASHFNPLKRTSAVEAFDILRASNIGWNAEAYQTVNNLRVSDPEDANGHL